MLSTWGRHMSMKWLENGNAVTILSWVWYVKKTHFPTKDNEWTAESFRNPNKREVDDKEVGWRGKA